MQLSTFYAKLKPSLISSIVGSQAIHRKPRANGYTTDVNPYLYIGQLKNCVSTQKVTKGSLSELMESKATP